MFTDINFFKNGITNYTMMLFGFYSQERSSTRYDQEVEEPELKPGPYSPKVRVLFSTSCQL